MEIAIDLVRKTKIIGGVHIVVVGKGPGSVRGPYPIIGAAFYLPVQLEGGVGTDGLILARINDGRSIERTSLLVVKTLLRVPVENVHSKDIRVIGDHVMTDTELADIKENGSPHVIPACPRHCIEIRGRDQRRIPIHFEIILGFVPDR